MLSKVPHSFARDSRLGIEFRDRGRVGRLHPSCGPGDARRSEARVPRRAVGEEQARDSLQAPETRGRWPHSGDDGRPLSSCVSSCLFTCFQFFLKRKSTACVIKNTQRDQKKSPIAHFSETNPVAMETGWLSRQRLASAGGGWVLAWSPSRCSPQTALRIRTAWTGRTCGPRLWCS